MDVLKSFPNTFASDCCKDFIAVRMCILGFLSEALKGTLYVLVDYFTNWINVISFSNKQLGVWQKIYKWALHILSGSWTRLLCRAAQLHSKLQLPNTVHLSLPLGGTGFLRQRSRGICEYPDRRGEEIFTKSQVVLGHTIVNLNPWLLSPSPHCLGGWSGCTCSIRGSALLQSQALFKCKAFPLASVLLEYFSIEKCECTRTMSSRDTSCGFICSVQGRKALC